LKKQGNARIYLKEEIKQRFFHIQEANKMNKAIKILMVDDEDQFRATTQKILNKKGFETLLAANGEEALEKIKEGPDVVVLDVKMPGMDGHQVLREIKKQKPDLPVIMLTGHGKIPSAREALEQGAFDYLTKPCDVAILSAKIYEAYRSTNVARTDEEKSVGQVMVPITDYTTIREGETVGTAIKKLRESFHSALQTSSLMETGHRSIVVFDDSGQMKGMLAIVDLMNAIMPAYLSAPKPSMADSIQYSPMFWAGAFNREIKLLAKKQVREIMSPAPMIIAENANLMEAAYMMISNQARRLAVAKDNTVVGIIREQDLFFEMERIINH
jgi:CheY-like chemotaxis protein